MTAPVQEIPHSAPGWYPDPWSAGGLRWWDGAQWGANAAPLAQSGSTDGFAIASLVLGIAGGSVPAIVLGFVARLRIRRSGGLRSGTGMATAGIVLGSVWLAVTVALVGLAVSGVFSRENADDYSGVERGVAQTIDRFEAAREDSDGERMCSEVLTSEFAASYARSYGSCQAEWSKDDPGATEVDVSSIDVAGDTATAEADEYGTKWHFMLRRDGGEWRISWFSN
jgi:hypothetical protein